MSVFEELSARARQLTDNIEAVARAGEPIETLVAERHESLDRAVADWRHAPFRLIHGSAPAMLERYTLGMMGVFHPTETRELIEAAVRRTAVGLRMTAVEKETALADLRAQLRVVGGQLEQHRRAREAAGAETMSRTGDPGIYLLTDSDLQRVIAGEMPVEIEVEEAAAVVPPRPGTAGRI